MRILVAAQAISKRANVANGSLNRLLLTIACICLAPALAFAECGARPALMCELINNHAEIFVGRILSPVDDSLEWRMRVVRSYRGSAKGTINVDIGSRYDLGAFELPTIGKDYLFYVSKNVEDGKVSRSTGQACADWRPVEDVSGEELQFLATLRRGVNDGRISGTVSARQWWASGLGTPLPAVRITLKRGSQRRGTTTTDAAGSFTFDGLPAGRYTLLRTSPLPETLAADKEEESDEIEIVPHGCAPDEGFLALYRDSLPGTITGTVTLPPGYLPGANPIVVFRDGKDFLRTTLQSDGRFTVRMPPGEYVVAMTGGRFVTTYAPGTTRLEEARKVEVPAGETVTGVDIAVPATAEALTFTIKATFEDGRPVRDSFVYIVSNTSETRSERTNGVGVAVFSVGRDEVLSARGVPIELECASPVTVDMRSKPGGPESSQVVVTLRYSRSACRD